MRKPRREEGAHGSRAGLARHPPGTTRTPQPETHTRHSALNVEGGGRGRYHTQRDHATETQTGLLKRADRETESPA
eukprot:1953587-Rhodomonas_salina.1